MVTLAGAWATAGRADAIPDKDLLTEEQLLLVDPDEILRRHERRWNAEIFEEAEGTRNSMPGLDGKPRNETPAQREAREFHEYMEKVFTDPEYAYHSFCHTYDTAVSVLEDEKRELDKQIREQDRKLREMENRALRMDGRPVFFSDDGQEVFDENNQRIYGEKSKEAQRLREERLRTEEHWNEPKNKQYAPEKEKRKELGTQREAIDKYEEQWNELHRLADTGKLNPEELLKAQTALLKEMNPKIREEILRRNAEAHAVNEHFKDQISAKDRIWLTDYDTVPDGKRTLATTFSRSGAPSERPDVQTAAPPASEMQKTVYAATGLTAMFAQSDARTEVVLPAVAPERMSPATEANPGSRGTELKTIFKAADLDALFGTAPGDPALTKKPEQGGPVASI